jgi:glycosyltransferase involved in cell wall biosynthesis
MPHHSTDQVADGPTFNRVADDAPLGLASPLRVMFMVTSLPVGGAETLLAELVRRMDPCFFLPEICCLKERGPLGEELAEEVPVYHDLLAHKYDLRVWPRLVELLRERRTDVVVTVGAGDKMFWGRLAAKRVGVPVILSALHSTGWPDGVGRLNRALTPITDGFIAVADAHGEHMLNKEGFPAEKVFVIPNGVDTNRFAPSLNSDSVRAEIGVGATDPVVAIVAALRPEKNHELFLVVASRVLLQFPNAKFLIIGEGPRRELLEQHAAELGITASVRFLGSRCDVARLLSASDVFALTSHNEANPVSILEAMSVGKPVVATDVGSIHEAVANGRTGYLVPPGDATALAARLVELLQNPLRAQALGAAAREAVVENWSVEAMVRRYERLIASIYLRKRPGDRVDTFDDQASADDPIADDYVDEEWRNCEAPAEA